MKDTELIRYWAHMLDESMRDKASPDLGDRSYYAMWAQEFPQYADPKRLAVLMSQKFDKYLFNRLGNRMPQLFEKFARILKNSDVRPVSALIDVFDPGELTNTGYFWPQIPAHVYKAIVSRNRANLQGQTAYGVSPKVVKDCLDDICCSASILKLHSLDIDVYMGTAVELRRALKSTKTCSEIAKALTAVGNGDFGKAEQMARHYKDDVATILTYLLYCACTSLSTYDQSVSYLAKNREFEKAELDGEIDDWIDAVFEYVKQFGGGEWLTNDTDNGVFDDVLNDMKRVRYDVYERPDEAIPLISKSIDMAHARGDLATAFVEGGASTCWAVSNMGPDELYEDKKAFQRKFGGNPGFEQTFRTYWDTVRKRANGPEKDIEYWQNRPWKEFEDFVIGFDLSNRSQRRDAEYVADAKKHGAVLLGKKDGYEAWYVPTFEAAENIGAFYTGNSGHWCILNRDMRKWVEYTDGFGEFFIFLANVSHPRDDDYNKIALEIDSDGELVYVWDSEDESHVMSDSNDPSDIELNLPQDIKSVVCFAMEKFNDLADRIRLYD